MLTARRAQRRVDHGIIAALGLLLLVAAGGVASDSSGERELWRTRQKEAAGIRSVTLLKPSRPRRPKHPSNSTDSHCGGNGPVPAQPVISVTGQASTVPVDQLPHVKPDGVPRDPRYRAAKAAWKMRGLSVSKKVRGGGQTAAPKRAIQFIRRRLTDTHTHTLTSTHAAHGGVRPRRHGPCRPGRDGQQGPYRIA
jgi:hypothetical protein